MRANVRFVDGSEGGFVEVETRAIESTNGLLGIAGDVAEMRSP